MGTTLRWLGVILAATALDLLLRFGASPGFRGVLWGEAVVFPLTSLGLLLLRRSRPIPSGARGALQVILIWTFLLAGVRSGAWAAGVPVTAANLLVLALASVAVIRIAGNRRRKLGRQL
jgi:hypothetical protein